MRASRSLSTRMAALGAAVALAGAGLVGAVGLVATATPAGADTALGTTSCALSTGVTAISASVAATVTPSTVNEGNDFTLTGLVLSSNLVADATTSAAAGATLTVSFASTIAATNATPASLPVTFSGAVTLPNPFPVGSSAPISLAGTVGSFTANAGATSTSISLDPSGQLTATLGPVVITGVCTGPPPVVIATAPIIPTAAIISNVIPNAGDWAGGTHVKLVGKGFTGVSEVDFGGVPATGVQLLSPNVITCIAPQGAGYNPGGGNTQLPVEVTVTTPAGLSKLQPNDAFTYVDTTLGAIVTGVTPNVGPAAGANTVTIHGAGFGPADAPLAYDVYFGTVEQPTFTVVSDSALTATVPAGSGIVDVTVIGADATTPSPLSPADRYNYNPGYMLTASDGGVFSYGQVPGNAGWFGSAGNIKLNKPVVGMALTSDGGGYWLVASDGGVFAYGDATFYGSAGNIKLNKPVIGMAATPDGAGYWLVASDGGVFAYGDAIFRGSTGNIKLNKPVVGVASTHSGDGYLMTAADGGVFAFGDATFSGTTAGGPLAAPIVGIDSNPAGGYWLVGADGGVFAYGNATFHGSLSGTALAAPISAFAATTDGGGYWIVSQSGAVFNRGDAYFAGDPSGLTLNGPIMGFAPVQSQAFLS